MPGIETFIKKMRQNPKGIRFNYFGVARQSGSSHRIYKTPWADDPRVNIQNHKGKAKAYQVRQVLQAIDKLEA